MVADEVSHSWGVKWKESSDVYLPLITLVLTLIAMGCMLLIETYDPQLGLSHIPQLKLILVLLLVQCLLLFTLRWSLDLCFFLVLILQAVLAFISPIASLRGLALIVPIYLVGLHRNPRNGMVYLVAAVLLEGGGAVLGAFVAGHSAIKALLNWSLGSVTVFTAVLLLGMWHQSRIKYQKLTREHEANNFQRHLEKSLDAERRRIAGDLHDVSAHHLAGITVQAAAIKRLIDSDPEAAKQAAEDLRFQARQTLNGMRMAVNALRENGQAARLKDVPELVETTRNLGVSVTLDISTSLPQLSTMVDEAGYRIIQQALSNALEHAPGGAIMVDIKCQEKLEITVTNKAGTRKAEASSGGVGLRLMHERATSLGGSFTAGHTENGGWCVHVELPIEHYEENPLSHALTPGDDLS